MIPVARYAFVFLALTSVQAQVPEYLPLGTGNQWVYRSSSLGAPLVVEVLKTGEFEGRTYSLLHGLPPSDLWLRRLDTGAYVAYDPESRTERPWLDFSAETGASFPTAAHPCSPNASVQDRAYKGRFEVGNFENVAYVKYAAACADAGLISDFFLPYVGLLERNETTIAGQRSYSLVYARINNTLVVTAPSVGVALDIDKSVYESAETSASGAGSSASTVFARFSIRNTAPEPLEITFPTGQDCDFELRNESGAAVWRWSEGQGFTQAVRKLALTGEKNWAVLIPLRDGEGGILPSGRYTLEAWLATGPVPLRRARAAFELRARAAAQ